MPTTNGNFTFIASQQGSVDASTLSLVRLIVTRSYHLLAVCVITQWLSQEDFDPQDPTSEQLVLSLTPPLLDPKPHNA